jgi:hypothetical protein
MKANKKRKKTEQPHLSPARIKAMKKRFDGCKSQIAGLNWLSEGSVTENHPGTWRWTRKVKAKTVSVALSLDQAAAFRQAIRNHRILEKLIKQMRSISQTLLLSTLPGPVRRSPKHPKSSLS